jgi:hypothetical protein
VAELLRYAVELAIAEEIGRELARNISVSQPPQTAPAQISRRTKIIRLKDVSIPNTLVDESGVGELSELMISSFSKYYELSIYVDDMLLVKRDFTWFQNISPYSDWIDAFENNGTFVLRISGIGFRKGIKIYAEPVLETLTSSEKIVLSEVIVKIDIIS